MPDAAGSPPTRSARPTPMARHAWAVCSRRPSSMRNGCRPSASSAARSTPTADRSTSLLAAVSGALSRARTASAAGGAGCAPTKSRIAASTLRHPHRYGRACPGHPRLPRRTKNVDARDKPGHDDRDGGACTITRTQVRVRQLTQIQLLEEVVALVVDDDERREVNDLDAPDRFHAELGIFEHLDLVDAVLGEIRRGTADRAEIEAAIFLA